MASPIGHALAGYAVYLSGRSVQRHTAVAWVCLLMAIFPDLDFIPGILQGEPTLYHQGISHSIGAALLVSFAAAAFVGGGSFWKNWAVLCAAYLSHLVVDFFGPDGRPPYGQPLLWPIGQEHFISPISIFPGMHHAAAAHASVLEWTKGVLNLYNLRSIAVDIAVIGPFVFIANWFTKGFSAGRNDTSDNGISSSAG